MWDVIRKLMDSGATILLTTQYLEEADQLADRIAVIDHGKVIAEGTANELKKKVGTDRAELTFTNASDLEAAVKVLKVKTHVDEAKFELSFSVDKISSLTESLNLLEAAKISIASIAIHKPTLDDVFLQLTGKPAEDAEEQPKQKKTSKN